MKFFMSKSLILTLDPGSELTKVLVFEEKKGKLNLISKEERESVGIKRGQISDQEKFSSFLKIFLEEISKKFGGKIERCLVALNGPHLFSAPSKASISILKENQTILREDLERVVEEAKRAIFLPNKMVLDFFPFYFQVNGNEKVKNPIGLKGVKLETEGLVIGCFEPYFKILKESLFLAGINDFILVPSFLAQSQSVLLKREKEIGCCFLDLGAQTTTFSVFKDENLIHFGCLPKGTDELRKEIATKFKIDFELAKKIQLEYSNFNLKGKKGIERIEIEGETLNLNLRLILRILQQKIGAIFQQVFKELKKISQEKLPGGIILIGGGSEIIETKKIAKSKFNLPVKFGQLELDSRLERRFATCAGLIKFLEKEGKTSLKFSQKIRDFFKNLLP